MEIINDYFVQLGAIGMIILGLAWFAKTMLKMFIDNLKENEEQIKDKSKTNSEIEREFRTYLQESNLKNQEIIRNNSQAFRELSVSISKQTAYLEAVNNKCVK